MALSPSFPSARLLRRVQYDAVRPYGGGKNKRPHDPHLRAISYRDEILEMQGQAAQRRKNATLKKERKRSILDRKTAVGGKEGSRGISSFFCFILFHREHAAKSNCSFTSFMSKSTLVNPLPYILPIGISKIILGVPWSILPFLWVNAKGISYMHVPTSVVFLIFRSCYLKTVMRCQSARGNIEESVWNRQAARAGACGVRCVIQDTHPALPSSCRAFNYPESDESCRSVTDSTSDSADG